MTLTWQVIEGDATERLADLDASSIQCCVTSPPYYGLRDYGVEEQIGLEATPDAYVARLVDVFREVRRVLANDGTVWPNLGDSYASGETGRVDEGRPPGTDYNAKMSVQPPRAERRIKQATGLPQKNLLGIPWRVAFALQADGWYLRSDVIWSKSNPMPESVADRPTRSHEYLFLLSKSARYFYDAAAVREEDSGRDHARTVLHGQPSLEPSGGLAAPHNGLRKAEGRAGAGRNKRSVWTIATQPFPGAHFAVFPPKLIEPCILAGSRDGSTVLDPFCGSGTTGFVALRHGRSFVGIELSPEYAQMARHRITDDAPLLNSKAAA